MQVFMADKKRTLALLGATGSIGTSTLKLVEQFPERFRVTVLTAGWDVSKLIHLARQFHPEHVAIADPAGYASLRDGLEGSGIMVHAGPDAIVGLATHHADITVSAITGLAGLLPTLHAVRRGGIVAVANKESLVTAGAVLLKEAKSAGATILPVDSEHNAIYQAWVDPSAEHVESITLTASGGPFWDSDLEAMRTATPSEAVNHPNWSMGAKISVDSATMMNKGLEVLEAAVLFGLPEDRVRVYIHRHSVIHGMVAYRDGSHLAQFGPADMRVPISYALAWPERLNWNSTPFDLASLPPLEFEHPDNERFPCLEMAREASRRGGLAPTVLNAANEEAVSFFLKEKIGFLDIAALNGHMLDTVNADGEVSMESILEIDQRTRQACSDWLERHNRN